MKLITHNDDNMLKSDMNRVEGRVKLLLINSNDEILLGYSYNTYQFPGGHIEENENLDDVIEREIKEETGIELQAKGLEPFFVIEYLTKDYPTEGVNSYYFINYYVVHTDTPYNLDNISLTDNEKNGNFELRYIPLSKVEEELNSTLELNKINKVVVPEMLEVITEYKKR